MSDILPVCLQDILYSRKSELRKRKIICVKQCTLQAAVFKAAACFVAYMRF